MGNATGALFWDEKGPEFDFKLKLFLFWCFFQPWVSWSSLKAEFNAEL